MLNDPKECCVNINVILKVIGRRCGKHGKEVQDMQAKLKAGVKYRLASNLELLRQRVLLSNTCFHTGMLEKLTGAIVGSDALTGGGGEVKILKYITEPFTNRVVQVSIKARQIIPTLFYI